MKMTSSCWLEAYLGWLGQRVEILHVIQPEPLPEVSEDKGAVLLDLEVAGQVLLVEGVVVDLHLRERPEVVRHEHHRDAHVLQLLAKNMGRIKLVQEWIFPSGFTIKDCCYLYSVVDTPHENWKNGVVGTEKLSFGVFHLNREEECKWKLFYLEPFGFHFGQGALHLDCLCFVLVFFNLLSASFVSPDLLPPAVLLRAFTM